MMKPVSDFFFLFASWCTHYVLYGYALLNYQAGSVSDFLLSIFCVYLSKWHPLFWEMESILLMCWR